MKLKRSLTLLLLSFYGIGTILGAGIYALIGTVAVAAGSFTPFAFLVAATIAFFTALTYAELASRFPFSAGAALYTRQAFQRRAISSTVGWLVFSTGVVSAAVMCHGFVNYLTTLLYIPSWLGIIGIVLILGIVAIIGIYESATMIMWMTIIEISGLLLIIFVGWNKVSITETTTYFPNFDFADWRASLLGAFFAFYAYIGFEDMVNSAEETINPEKNIPYAIIIALCVTTLLYVLVAIVVIANLSATELTSKTPLTVILQQHNIPQQFFALIALVSIMNGILVQILMASRLIYGMGKQQDAPIFFTQLYAKTQTPARATLFVMLIIIIAALLLPITTLAKITSSIMLSIFIIVQAALIKVKFHTTKPKEGFSIPIFIPMIGLCLCLGFLLSQILL